MRQEVLRKELIAYSPKKWAVNIPGKHYAFKIEDWIPALSGAIGKVALLAAFSVAWAKGLGIVHPDFVTMETNYVNHLKNCIENLEKLRNQDPNDLSFRSRDEENYIRSEFDNRKKDLEEGNAIIYLVLRRDGECPDSQIENKLATDNNLETFLLDQGFVFKSFRQEYM